MAAAGFRVSPFRKLLNKIADNLTDRDMTTLKFLCEDKIPKAILSGISDGKAMFAELLSRRVILDGDLTALEDLLQECNREDLVYLLEKFREETVDRRQAPSNGEHQAAGMAPRRGGGTAAVVGSMSELHRSILRDHRATLVSDMHTRHVLPYLLATGILTDRLEAEIINTGGSRQAMNEALLQVLPTRGDQAFRELCTALRTGSQQNYLADALEQAENSAQGLDRPQPLVMTDSEGPAYPHADFSLQDANSNNTTSILVFKFNPNTAHRDVRLSHDNNAVYRETIKNERTETACGRDQFVDTRFLPNPTVLGDVSVSSSVYYWEVNVRSSLTYRIGVAYKNVPRHLCLGDSNASWCLVHSLMECSGRHNGKSFPMNRPSPERVGVLLDFGGGRLSFCDVERRRILHTFLAHFSQPLYPAFSVWDGELSLVSVSEVPMFL
ncbi:E3 ubiquitin-protein ligase TRIM41-like isoform X2 [Branchiostoma floridae]|uniref:E3 ubiquitin-protein ligase TRIM41-like isoform X2 n=1 Tax=Branchiostoma floridae TaxID=7739 RepID=A0A9J7LX52_BRAFL|nr:E3 ubiquitin-protein ligase TRIM41-like isoform X2 [Branchiostoma floridae]